MNKRSNELPTYQAPVITVVGTVQELTAGPVTPVAEIPSGQKSSESDRCCARVEDE